MGLCCNGPGAHTPSLATQHSYSGPLALFRLVPSGFLHGSIQSGDDGQRCGRKRFLALGFRMYRLGRAVVASHPLASLGGIVSILPANCISQRNHYHDLERRCRASDVQRCGFDSALDDCKARHSGEKLPDAADLQAGSLHLAKARLRDRRKLQRRLAVREQADISGTGIAVANAANAGNVRRFMDISSFEPMSKLRWRLDVPMWSSGAICAGYKKLTPITPARSQRWRPVDGEIKLHRLLNSIFSPPSSSAIGADEPRRFHVCME